MQKVFYTAVLSAAFLGLAACSSGSDDPVDNATTTDGETTVGETTDGETTAGAATDGATDGETTAGAATDGETTGGVTTDGETTGGVTTDGETTGGGTPGGGTTGGVTIGGGTLSGNVLRFGIVEVDDDEGELDLFAFFGAFETNLSANQFVGELLPTLDTCEVEIFGVGGIPDLDDLDDDNLIFDSNFNSLSAGETITISSPAGTFSTLVQFTFGDLIGYGIDETGVAPVPPVPSGLVVDIPGDEFPAFSNVDIPDVAQIVVTAPTPGTAITPTTQFTWVPGGDSDALLDLSVTSFDAQGMGVGVDCVLEDDGSFSFPASVQSQMGTGFTSPFFDFNRTRFNLIQNGTTVLATINIASM